MWWIVIKILAIYNLAKRNTHYITIIFIILFFFINYNLFFIVFTTTIESGLSSSYKYVVLDKDEKVVEEEDILRTYTPETSSINEVFNRYIPIL